MTPGEAAAHERGCLGNAFRACLEVIDVGLDRFLPDVGDRSVAGREPDRRHGLHRLGHLLGEIGELVQAHHRARDFFDRALAAEAGQPVLDVGGVAGLAHLAVVGDSTPASVWAARFFAPPAVLHPGGGLIDRLARLLREDERVHPVGRGRLPACVVRIRIRRWLHSTPFRSRGTQYALGTRQPGRPRGAAA